MGKTENIASIGIHWSAALGLQSLECAAWAKRDDDANIVTHGSAALGLQSLECAAWAETKTWRWSKRPLIGSTRVPIP